MDLRKIILSFAAAMLCAVSAYAAAAPCDLIFTQEQGGKFIYCNNIESITATDLADKSNENAKFIMNNDGLTPDRYVFFGAFINRTNTVMGGASSGRIGFDIDVDVLFRADEDCKITISGLGFEVPQHSSFFLDGVLYPQENEWGGFGAWASYFGVPIKQIDSGNVYEPMVFSEQTVELEAGESFWLSELLDNYRSVPLARSVHIAADFTIDYGKCDVDVAALRSKGRAGDRSGFYEDAAYGSFLRDRQYKGISDGLNEVTAELKYEIDDSDENGAYLPVTVYNQYAPEGNTVGKFYTNLNPRADQWSYALCAESDMLAFSYYDPIKRFYYGSSIKDDAKDDYYIFDTHHTDQTEYIKGYGSYALYVPNRELTDKDDTKYACNLGNYGVIYNYNIKITNTGNKRRYLIYRLATSSNNLVWVRNQDGSIANGRVLAKGRNTARIADDMVCLPIPAQSSVKYTVCMLLAANYSGGMENAFVLSDYPKPIETYETERSSIQKDSAFDGREYYRWDGEGLNISDDGITWTAVDLPENVINGIAGNFAEYRLEWTGSGYTLRPTLYDAGSFGFIDHMYRDMYLLDEDFGLVRKQTFGGYPSGYACANGVHYVEISGTAFRSTTDFKWWDVTDITLPCWNYGTFSAVCDNGVIKLSSNGINFYTVDYHGFRPEYIDANGSRYYCADGRTLYLSQDGLNWRYVVFNEKVKSFAINGNEVIANGNETRPLPEFDDNVAIRLDDKYISTEPAALAIDNSPYIPLRVIGELLGYKVTWDNGVVVLERGGVKTEITDITMIGETAYAPLRILVVDLGHNVQYDGVKREAIVQSGEITK